MGFERHGGGRPARGQRAAQTGGHEIDVSPADVATTVFDAGTLAGTDMLWAQLLQSNGTLTGWQAFTVTVPMPSLTVHNDASATKSQVINLSILVTISDPGNVGHQKLCVVRRLEGRPRPSGRARRSFEARAQSFPLRRGNAATTWPPNAAAFA